MTPKFFICLFAFLIINNTLRAQSLLHSASGEIGGHAVVYGLSYDLRFKTDSLVNFGLGTVGSVFIADYYGHSAATLRGFCTIGRKKSCFETGMDIMYDEFSSGTPRSSYSYSTYTTYLQAYLGYRYQPVKGGLLLRAYAVPLSFKINNKTEFAFPPLGAIGVSLGYTFNPKTAK
jgi:hypothetical protein